MALATAAVFNTRPEAEMARARLEAAGLTASVHGDDAGGMLPDLSSQGVKVLVPEDELTEATAILSEPPDPAWN